MLYDYRRGISVIVVFKIKTALHAHNIQGKRLLCPKFDYAS